MERLPASGLELAWAADPIDLFFVQIQGSGTAQAARRPVMRIGYADQNGRDYVAVGRLLRDRGILAAGRRKYGCHRRLDARPAGWRQSR